MTPALNANHNPGVSLTSVVKQTSATAHEVRPRVRACLFILRATGFNLSRTSNHNHTDHPHCNGDAEYGQAPFVKEHLLGRRITAKSERERSYLNRCRFHWVLTASARSNTGTIVAPASFLSTPSNPHTAVGSAYIFALSGCPNPTTDLFSVLLRAGAVKLPN